MAEVTQHSRHGLYELTDEAKAELAGSKYFNEDLAPTTLADRTWNTYHVSMLWVGMAICIPSLGMAMGGVAFGLPVWASILNVILGNAIILVPIQLNSNAGTKYGIPFPIFARMTFGMRGAQIPALSRAVVACGWNMVQCTLGGTAIGFIVKALVPAFNDQSILVQVIFFIIFMIACGVVTAAGSKAIRIFESFSSPLLIVLIILLLVWAIVLANGAGYSFGDVFNSELSAGGLTMRSQYIFFFLLTLTGNIGFWATMALNIPDFSRYAKSQKVQFRGQMYGMLPAMAFCAIVGAFYAQATFLVYGTPSDNPIGVLGFLGDSGLARLLIVIVGIGIIFATMTTNIAANIVAPANAFSNLSPKRVGYKFGVVLACIIAGLAYGIPYFITVAQGGGFIGFMFDFLNYYGAFLAPLAAIFILDYYFVKRKNLDVKALFMVNGRYWYQNGFNVAAIIAWVAGAILPTITGIAGFTEMSQGPLAWINANSYLFSFFVALIVYGIIAPRKGAAVLTDEEEAAMTKEIA